jgi:hypothetical protein
VHVVFDFDGALQLANRLATLADEWEQAFATFGGVVDAALGSWTGPRRDRVAERFAAERGDSATVVASLRSEADRWAMAWAEAVDDLRHERWLALAVTGVGGPHVPPPAPAGIPGPPAYEPTVAVAVGGHPADGGYR